MDYEKITLNELKNGYSFDESRNVYVCNYCEIEFPIGQVFSIENKLYEPMYAVSRHIELEHGGTFTNLLHSDTKYNTLTDNQKELLSLFGRGISDNDIAKHLNVSPSTIRHQKFTFREKAKQAKLYLALYELAFDKKFDSENSLIPIHNTATMLDDRYVITEKEKNKILETEFKSLDPLRLNNFPPKEKKKIVILSRIVKEFQANKKYTEREVTEILKEIYDDHVVLRRYLVDYGFMSRTKDGKHYWIP